VVDQCKQMDGVRTLVVGASSGIGRAFAIAARENGARVAVAARRMSVLNPLAVRLGGTAHELDVTNPQAIDRVVREAAEALGAIDAVFFSSVVVPLARVEHVDAVTWAEAFAVNATGPALVIRAVLPYLSDDAVILIASDGVGTPRAGIAAYSASKAALDEILRSWRCEHPDLRVIRVGIGPTDETEIFRGADEDMLGEFFDLWTRKGQVPEKMSRVTDVANTMVSVISAARSSATLVTEIVHLAPRSSKKPPAVTVPDEHAPADAGRAATLPVDQ